MRYLRILGCAILFVALLCLPPLGAAAEEEADWYAQQVEASGAENLIEILPEETRALLRSIGITDFSYEQYAALQPEQLLQTVLKIFGEQSGGVMSSCGLLLGIVVLCAVAESLKQTMREPKTAELFLTICTVSACGALLLPVSECIRQVAATAESVSVFMLSFVPVYASLIFAGGQTKLALSYSTVLMAGAECTSAVVTEVVLPVLMLSLGISTVGVLSVKSRISSLGGMLTKFSGWLLGVVTAGFTALLSMQSAVAASADSIGQRAAKMSIGTFVPIVGGALSEAFGTVTGCVRALRSTLGMFGIAATLLIVLPPLCHCFAWSIALSLCGAVSELFGSQPISALLKAVHTVIKTAIGILAACGLLLIISTTLVTILGGSV